MRQVARANGTDLSVRLINAFMTRVIIAFKVGDTVLGFVPSVAVWISLGQKDIRILCYNDRRVARPFGCSGGGVVLGDHVHCAFMR